MSYAARLALATMMAVTVPGRSAGGQAACDSAAAGGANPCAQSAQRRPEPTPWIIRHTGLALGVATASSLGLAALDHPALRELTEPSVRRRNRLHEVADDFAVLGGAGPLVASSALAAVSSGHPRLQRFAIHNTEAIAMAAVLTGVAKGIAGRALPEVAAKHSFELGRGFHEGNGPFVSFPSGHTAAAFAFASTVAGELAYDTVAHARLLGGIAFGAASAVGVARVVQRVHWPSDLPIGAFIGMWSGYAVQARAHRFSALNRAISGLNVSPDGHRRIAIGWSPDIGIR